MAMSTGGGGGVKSEINVTPLVDVVLVLLIIFMVVTPLLQMGYAVNTPPKVTTVVAPPTDDQLIVRMDRDGRVYINKQLVTVTDFTTRLREAMKGRESKIIFFAADGELEYDKVATFLDMTRKAGATNIGIVFDDIRGTTAAPAS